MLFLGLMAVWRAVRRVLGREIRSWLEILFGLGRWAACLAIFAGATVGAVFSLIFVILSGVHLGYLDLFLAGLILLGLSATLATVALKRACKARQKVMSAVEG